MNNAESSGMSRRRFAMVGLSAGAALVAAATVVAFIHLAAFAVLAPAVVCAVVPGLAVAVVVWAGAACELEFPEFPASPTFSEGPFV